jgi:hypothetical protein
MLRRMAVESKRQRRTHAASNHNHDRISSTIMRGPADATNCVITIDNHVEHIEAQTTSRINIKRRSFLQPICRSKADEDQPKPSASPEIH